MTIAKTQYKLSASDVEIVLSLKRAGTLAEASARLQLDASTVFRSIQRIEKGLGQRLFDRSRTGYVALENAQLIAHHAEQMEVALEAARGVAQSQSHEVSGSVRITTTDSLLHGLLMPLLPLLAREHPLLQLDLHTGNEVASLTRRDADIAIRATNRPPPHLIGTRVGPIRVAVFARKSRCALSYDQVIETNVPWISVDDALPEHPSVRWRKRNHPKIAPKFLVSSILSVRDALLAGLGVGILPLFLAASHKELVQLSEPLDDAQSELWLLTHTDTRHLRRVAAAYGFLSTHLQLV